MLSQMMRWGHIAPEVDIARIAARVYRPDLHAEAVSDLGRPATQPLEALDGFSTLGSFRLADAHDHAARGALSRICRV